MNMIIKVKKIALDKARFNQFNDKAGKWRYYIQTQNRKIMLQSKAYKSKQAALNGIKHIKEFSEACEIFVRETTDETTPMKTEEAEEMKKPSDTE